MIKTVILFTLTFICLNSLRSQVITELNYQNRPHYKVSISNATFFIDKFSGGISSIVDREGKDWIQWKRLHEEKYPNSAAGDYRGTPNLVYGGEDNGIGHPGFDKALSFKKGNKRIRVQSMNAKWEWEYRFHNTYVEIKILKTPVLERNYWILYEGIPGGEFNPQKNYWGTQNGINAAKPDYLKGEESFGYWRWVFFGHKESKQTLFLLQKNEDEMVDLFGFLGNSEKGLEAEDGMVVFGFGRDKKAKPLMNKNQIFYMGFYNKQINQSTFSKFKKWIEETFY